MAAEGALAAAPRAFAVVTSGMKCGLQSPLAIVDLEAAEIHVVDRWRYLGAASCEAEFAELLERRRTAVFDHDHYRILARHLGRKGVRTIKLAEEGAAACTAS